MSGIVLVAASLSTVAASMPQASSSAELITWAHESGITKFDSWASFHADAPVTREQAAKMIVTWVGSHNELGLSMPDGVNCSFKDAASIDSTLSYGVESACAYGLFKGYKGNFMPKNLLTREDARTLLVRALDQLPAYESYRNEIPAIKAGFLTRGELIKALYSINVVVEAKIADQKDQSLTAAQTKLNAAISLWNSKDINNYTATQQLSCFCTPNSTHPISFEVKNDLVVSGSVKDVNETDKIPANELLSTPKTVEQMFALIQDAIDRKADSMTIEYDATLGVPMKINIDYSTMMADEEMYYTYSVQAK